MGIKQEDILQVQYLKYYTKFHISIYGSEKCLCGKALGMSCDLFAIAPDSHIEKWCSCKNCIKAFKKLDK